MQEEKAVRGKAPAVGKVNRHAGVPEYFADRAANF